MRAPEPAAAPGGAGWIAGVDIGGTAVKLGLVAAESLAAQPTGPGAPQERPAAVEIAVETEIATPIDIEPQAMVAQIATAVRAIAAGRPLRAVGIGCAGLVSSPEGIVHTSPNLPRWREVALGALAREALRLPASVLNDANAFALAEARLGAGRGRSPIVAITCGTGVGGAIVEAGRLRGGRHGFGGELGHMSLAVDGAPCPCGNRGCLELFLGRRPLVAAYLERCRRAPGEPPCGLAGGDRDSVTPKRIADAAARGDEAAREAFRLAGEALGAALANLSNLIDPEAFVVGGGLAQAGELLLGPARRVFAERAMIGPERAAPVLPAALGYRAGLLGAALQAADDRGAEAGS